MDKIKKAVELTINGKNDNTFELEIRTRAGCELNYNGNLIAIPENITWYWQKWYNEDRGDKYAT